MTYLRLRSDILGNEDGAPARAVLCIMAFLLCWQVPGSLPWFIGGMVGVIMLDMAMSWLDDRKAHKAWEQSIKPWRTLTVPEIVGCFLDDWFVWARYEIKGCGPLPAIMFNPKEGLCSAFWHWVGVIGERYRLDEDKHTASYWRAICMEAQQHMRSTWMGWLHGTLKQRVSQRDPFMDSLMRESHQPVYENALRLAFVNKNRTMHFHHLLR